MREAKVPPFEVRRAELCGRLINPDTNLVRLSKSSTLLARVNLLTNLFDDKAARATAMEVYIRRVYQIYAVLELKVEDTDGRLLCSFEFEFADILGADCVTRNGFFSVIRTPGTLPWSFLASSTKWDPPSLATPPPLAPSTCSRSAPLRI